MRIIGGEFRGRKFNAPKNIDARPTTDFAKEGIFNVLNNHFYFDEIKYLDLFAGIGSLSYEMLSRGCEDITCVDSGSKQINFINKTFQELKFENCKTYLSDVFQYLKNCKVQYDLIIADPPYALENISEIVNLVNSNKLIKEGGLLVVEHGKQTNLADLPNFKKEKKYGNVHFSIFEY